MTLHESASGESLLARKGAAVPASLNGAGLGSAEPPFRETGLAQKPFFEASAKPAPDGAEGAGPAPPASLLAFDFLNERTDDGPLLPSKETDEPKIAALAPEAEKDEPKIVALAPEPEKDEPQIMVRAPELEPAPAVKPHAPAVEPTWRVGVDTLATSRRTDGWTGRTAALVLVLGVVVIGWYAASRERGVMVEKPVTVTTAPSEPAAAEPTPAAMPSEPAKTPPEAAPAEAETPAHAPGAPQSADNPQSMDQTKAVEPAQPAEAAGPAEPSVDVVRIDPDGSVVIAGRAAPNADLIILDNGAPIGTATADSFGEWIFIPDLPLPSGGHAFGLVVKSIKGRMSVPAPGEGEAAPQEEPAKPDSEANAVPIPPRKPIPAGDTDFTVQLASVETKAGAAREWQVLKDRFPRILGGMKVSLDKAKVGGSGTAVRVRTGGFATLRDAIDLCARLTAKRQECLVIREPLAN